MYILNKSKVIRLDFLWCTLLLLHLFIKIIEFTKYLSPHDG